MKKHWVHKKLPFFGKEKVDRFLFPNGLKLFVIERKIAPVFSYQTWFNVGSRDEEKGKSGLAHLFEHMMFKGTKKMPQGAFDRAIESAGARDLNAFTSTDYTAYVASLPVEAFELIAGLEADRMVGLAITNEQFQSEREVVRNERKQRTDNNPEGQMFEEFQRLAFQAHPYGRPVIGFEADLDAMDINDCREFYKTHYAPNNAVIAVIGDLKPEKVASIIHKHYGHIPSVTLPNLSVEKEPDQREERRAELKLELQVQKTFMGYRVPPAVSKDQAALSVLCSILSSGRSSRLYRLLVDTGIALDVSASSSGAKDPTLLYVTFTSQPKRTAEEGIEIIDREISQLIKNGVKELEVERAKNKIRTEVHQGMITNSALAHFIGQSEIVMGNFEKAIEELHDIEKVTATDIANVAKKYLIQAQRTMVIGRPV